MRLFHVAAGLLILLVTSIAASAVALDNEAHHRVNPYPRRSLRGERLQTRMYGGPPKPLWDKTPPRIPVEHGRILSPSPSSSPTPPHTPSPRMTPSPPDLITFSSSTSRASSRRPSESQSRKPSPGPPTRDPPPPPGPSIRRSSSLPTTASKPMVRGSDGKKKGIMSKIKDVFKGKAGPSLSKVFGSRKGSQSAGNSSRKDGGSTSGSSRKGSRSAGSSARSRMSAPG